MKKSVSLALSLVFVLGLASSLYANTQRVVVCEELYQEN